MNRHEQALDHFNNALAQLEEALTLSVEDTRDRDAIILRFQLSYETCWKALKHCLYSHEAIEANSPKSAIKSAYQQGWLGSNETLWLSMIEDRNLIVHTYNEDQAQRIYEHVKNYATALREAHRAMTALN